MEDAMKNLQAELENLRSEALRQVDGWDAERRESQRLRAMVVRFRTQSEDFAEESQRLAGALKEAHARIALLESESARCAAIAAALRAALSTYGSHKKDCAFKPKKAESLCTCGLTELLKSE